MTQLFDVFDTDTPWLLNEIIRNRLSSGERQVTLAREYGVRDSTISRIKTGRRWHG